MKWLAGIVGVVLVVVVLVGWRPWGESPDSALMIDLDPAKLVTIICVNKSGTPCKLTLDTNAEGNPGRLSSFLTPKGSATLKTAGPRTLEAATVERGNGPQGQELNVPLDAGKTYEARVGADGRVGVTPRARSG
jgi:hypothetical protein